MTATCTHCDQSGPATRKCTAASSLTRYAYTPRNRSTAGFIAESNAVPQVGQPSGAKPWPPSSGLYLLSMSSTTSVWQSLHVTPTYRRSFIASESSLCMLPTLLFCGFPRLLRRPAPHKFNGSASGLLAEEQRLQCPSANLPQIQFR